MVVADELGTYGASGDGWRYQLLRGLDYIVAMLQAGLIAVPLPVPQFSSLDDAFRPALQRGNHDSHSHGDKSVVDDVMKYMSHGHAAPTVGGDRFAGPSEYTERSIATRYAHSDAAYIFSYTRRVDPRPAGVVSPERHRQLRRR